MKIALLGDAHGDLAALTDATRRAFELGAGAALQLGDLGFTEQLLGAGRMLPSLPIPVYALCGNHEDHAFLLHACRSGLARRWAERGLIYQPRGSVASIGRVKVGFLGGAMHIDRPQEGLNRPSTEDLQRAIAAFSATRPQIIATHSCPAGIGVGMRGNDGFAQALHDHVRRAGIDPGPPDDCGEPALSALWEALPACPALWCFGHFHYFHEARVKDTLFLSAPLLAANAPILLWQYDTLAYTTCWPGNV